MYKSGSIARIVVIAICLITLSFLFAGNAAAYKKIKCFMFEPPEQVLPSVKKIAILDFAGTGDAGKRITDYMIAEIIKDDRGIHDVAGGLFSKGREGVSFLEGATTAIFSVVERSRLDQIMEEQKLGLTGLIDDNQAASLGKIMGVDAIITGTVSYSHRDTLAKLDNAYFDIATMKSYAAGVDCLTRRVDAASSMRIVDVDNGQIIGAKDVKRYIEEKKCGEEKGSIPSVEEMSDACIRAVAGGLVSYFSPYYAFYEWEFEGIKLKQFKKKGDNAAALAEKGDLDRAYAIYYKLSEQDPYNDRLHYNLGVLNEVVGNFEQALEQYNLALKLRKSGRYEESVKRTQKQIDFWSELDKMDIQLVKREFGTSAADLQKAMVSKVEVKGESDDRIEVKAEPNQASAAVAKVPGGVQLEVISVSGDWIKVKLLGGKEGYLPREKVEM